MKEFFRRVSAVFFDLRFIVACCGTVLSVVAHELFHIIVHWGEITDINLLPDSQAIVEVLFIPSADYDIVTEEALAYTVTMATLILTAMLVSDIHDARDSRTVLQIISDGSRSKPLPANDEQAAVILSGLLDVKPLGGPATDSHR